LSVLPIVSVAKYDVENAFQTIGGMLVNPTLAPAHDALLRIRQPALLPYLLCQTNINLCVSLYLPKAEAEKGFRMPMISISLKTQM
jgi:hypothetical protein